MNSGVAPMGVSAPRPLVHRKSRFGANSERVARALIIASVLYSLVLALMAVLIPLRKSITRVVELPERTATILIEAPKPQLLAPPVVTEANLEQLAVREVADPPMPEGIVNEPRALPVKERAPLDPDLGREGRHRAEEATAQLASATAALDGALDGLSSSLRDAQSGTPEPSRRRRVHRMGGGRGEEQLAGFNAGRPAGSGADLEHSGVTGSIIAIGNLAPARAEEGGGEPHARPGSAPGVYRNNASLLAVIQRYAAGIQYCYENELNRQPGLRGKLVVALTVAASGEVTEASALQNTLGSASIAHCALSQIRQWKFPPIPAGVTTFQTPFIFTPPS